MGDFVSSLKKADKKTSAKDKVTGFFLNRKDECFYGKSCQLLSSRQLFGVLFLL